MSKKVETKHAVICAKAETARMEHLIDGHWKPAVERLQAELERVRTERDTLAHALEQILHVGLYDMQEWETVEQIIKGGIKGFNVLALLGRLDSLVDSLEGLAELPVGTAILDGGDCVAVKGGTDGAWFYPMGSHEPMLPATVLWLPESS